MGIFSTRDKNAPINEKQKQIRRWWLNKVVTIVGIKFTVLGNKPDNNHAALWVSNHISWLDIPILGSLDVAFLSKSEVRNWPVLGWLGLKAGTVFIQRGGKNASQIASKTIANSILGGESVLVFPEATVTDGTDVKRFYARIFATAIDHNLPVQPIAIRYLDEKGNHHPSIVWGDESFLSNVVTILGEKNIHVEVMFLDIIDSNGYTERNQLADLAWQNIREVVTMYRK